MVHAHRGVVTVGIPIPKPIPATQLIPTPGLTLSRPRALAADLCGYNPRATCRTAVLRCLMIDDRADVPPIPADVEPRGGATSNKSNTHQLFSLTKGWMN